MYIYIFVLRSELPYFSAMFYDCTFQRALSTEVSAGANFDTCLCLLRRCLYLTDLDKRGAKISRMIYIQMTHDLLQRHQCV